MSSDQSPRRLPALRRGAAVAAVLAAALLAWLALDGRLGVSTARDGPAPASSVPPRPSNAFELTVEYVFDGDTIEARMSDANDVAGDADPVRVRLIGIDTPEGTPSPECWADEARDHLRDLLPEGATVWAASDIEARDRFGRLLLYLWTDDGRFVNRELVAAGDAEALLVEPNSTHFALLSAAEASARSAGIGRWGACT
jgi:endonuclease YncB( thermonuclease family)